MIREARINLIRFGLLIVLQIFVLNNIQFSGYINPYLYVLFILLYPFEFSGWFLLILGFIMGLIIDISSSTIGYHTISTVFMAYSRFHLMRLIAPRGGYESGMSPTPKSLGYKWFLKYVSILTIVHHLILFWIESFRFGDLIFATLRALASSVFTILLIVIYQLITIRKK